MFFWIEADRPYSKGPAPNLNIWDLRQMSLT
jgi:hypothetical protein